jgi:alpha-1,3-rhamnosyl/mannosyltransferase
MKIMVDVTAMVTNKTGIGYYTERLVTSLAKIVPDDVEVVGFYYNFLGRRDASHLPKAKNLRYAKLSLVPGKIAFQLRRWGIEFPVELFSLERADFILYPNFLSHPSLFRSPSAPVIHDLTYLDLPEYVSPKLQRDLVRFVPKSIKRSEFVITVSEYSKQKIMQAYAVPSEKILVTHIPPLPVEPMDQKSQQREREKDGITQPYILFVGTIDPRKNIIGLIDAYAKLPQSLREKYRLVLAGRVERLAGKEVARIEQARQEGLGVTHLGYVSDTTKHALYQGATLFVSASQYEGFGMPLLEAMNYGVPCAVSNIPVFTEIAGQAAAYFDFRDTTKISGTIRRLLENPAEAQKLGKAGLKHAATFSWEEVAGSVFKKIQASLASSTASNRKR